MLSIAAFAMTDTGILSQVTGIDCEFFDGKCHTAPFEVGSTSDWEKNYNSKTRLLIKKRYRQKLCLNQFSTTFISVFLSNF